MSYIDRCLGETAAPRIAATLAEVGIDPASCAPGVILLVERLCAAQEATTALTGALVHCERRVEATFWHAPIGIAHVSIEGAFLRVNPQFAAITGHGVADLMRHGFQQITHPDDLASDLANVASLLSGERSRYRMEKRYLRPDGSVVWVNLTVALVRDAVGVPDFFVSVIEDLSEIKRAHAEALRDPLTQLLNRRGFVEEASHDRARGGFAEGAVSLVGLDLDGFKRINDELGHARGDQCLIAVARRLEAELRANDVLARFGGDEFVMLIPGLPIGDAADRVEVLRRSLETLATEGWPITGSFGVVSPAHAGEPIDALIQRADRAALAAKAAGKNRVVCG